MREGNSKNSSVGMAAIPPSVFDNRKNDYKVLRFCFAKKDETLQEAMKKLCAV
jgi:methionine aminotransferase